MIGSSPGLTSSSPRSRHRARRSAALLLGVAVGVVVAFLTNRIIYGAPPGGYGSLTSLVGFWGLVFGSLAIIGTVRGVLALRFSRSASGVGLAVAAGVLALVGALTASWIMMWRVTLLSLEGAWLYPLATGGLLLAALLTRKARPLLRGQSHAMPASASRDSDDDLGIGRDDMSA